MLRAFGPSGLRLPRSLRSHSSFHPHFASPGRLSFGKDASQSPYSGCQTVAYTRNVMRNTILKFFKKSKKLVDKNEYTVFIEN
jgi:hypothetical protein